MITTKWGPPGWKFGHKVAFTAQSKVHKAKMTDEELQLQLYHEEFFTILQYILGCKYCRESYAEFLREIPIKGKNLGRWFYDIHNKVNDKLRRQEAEAAANKLKEMQNKVANDRICVESAMNELQEFAQKTIITEADPSFSSIVLRYMTPELHVDRGEMWVFLGSMVFNYPEPFDTRDRDHQQKRMYLQRLFELLPHIVPYTNYRERILDYMKSHKLKSGKWSRKYLVHWFHKLFTAVAHTKWLPAEVARLEKLENMCSFFESFRAGNCSKPATKTRIASCRAPGR
jgi:hypothetical protein